MKINKTKPPKDREFLGLVAARDGESPACYVDRMFFDMPKILGWIEVPDLEEE